MSAVRLPQSLATLVCSLLPFVLLSPAPARAAEGDGTQALPPLVVSASRVEQPGETVGSSVVVLVPEELRERGIAFVADALAEVPSLALASQGPRGSQTQVRIRGNEANHVLVLIDGMRVGNASTGEYDLANLSLEGVERIEVLLGPQGTLYGSDAIAGVISITTRKGQGAPNGNVRLEGGSLGTRTAAAHLGGSHGGWHYAVTADRYHTDGISAADEDNGNGEKDGYDTTGVKLKAGYDHALFHTWVVLDGDRSRLDFDGEDYVTGLAVDQPANRQWVDSRAGAWVLEAPLLDGRLNNRLQLSHTRYDYETWSEFFGSGSNYQSHTRRDALEYAGGFVPDAHNHLRFGGEWREERLETSGFSPFDRSVTHKGLYLDWLIAAGDLDLTVGGRHDQHEAFGGHDTYRLTASYRVTPRWRIRAARGTGYKAPSLQELYDPGFGGNPELRPEESTATELGVELAAGGLNAGLTLYEQEVHQLIRYQGSYPTGVNENVGRAHSNGVELALDHSWRRLTLDAALAWTRATENDGAGTRDRLRVPEWAGQLTARYGLNRGSLWAEARYQGERPDRNFATGETVQLDAYWLFNLGASFDPVPELTLSARIDNLLDQDYETVYSYGTRGRTGLVSLAWRF